MKLPFSKPLKIALLGALPLALFLVARERASWRPHKVAGLPYDGQYVISPDERFVANATKNAEGLITIRDLSNGEEVRHNAFRHAVSNLAFSPDGRELAMAWTEPTSPSPPKRLGVGVWNFEGKGRQFERLKDVFLFDSPTQVRYSPDGKTLWLASTDNLRSWDVASGRLTWQWRQGEMEHDSSLPYFSSLSQDCRFYCRSDSDGYSVWDTRSRRRIVHTKLPFLADTELDFSGDGLYALYLTMDDPDGSYFAVVDATKGRVLWHSEQPSRFCGGKAVTSSLDNVEHTTEYEVRDVRTGKLLYRLPSVYGGWGPDSTSSDWLYSVSSEGERELFRQRLR